MPKVINRHIRYIMRTLMYYLIDKNYTLKSTLILEIVDFKKIRHLLKDKRTKLGLTQLDIATELNITQVSYCAYETGKSKIPLESLIFLKKKYRLSYDDFFESD